MNLRTCWLFQAGVMIPLFPTFVQADIKRICLSDNNITLTQASVLKQDCSSVI